MPNEAKLLYDALLYENGHLRRTQHILKVYGLAKFDRDIVQNRRRAQISLLVGGKIFQLTQHFRKAVYL